MIVFLNGSFVPEEDAKVSVLDRGFLYGDGLFETIRVSGGNVFEWPAHAKRLQAGADFLRLSLAIATAELLAISRELIRQNSLSEALLRITVSRGIGVRGYSPKGATNPTVAITVHPAQALPHVPPQWKLHIASVRLPSHEELSYYKTCNKLPQILAKTEAESNGADEALLCNTDGFVVEGASSNLFWIENGQLHTPPLVSGVLAGVTRNIVIEAAGAMGLETVEETISPETLMKADGVFLSLSSVLIAEAISINGTDIRRSDVTQQIYKRLLTLMLQKQLNPLGS